MHIVIEEVLPIKPNIIRVKLYTVSDVNAEKPIVINYELAVFTNEFVKLRDEKTAEIDIDLFKEQVSKQLSELQDTANLAKAIETANLSWDIVPKEKEPVIKKKGKTLAFGDEHDK